MPPGFTIVQPNMFSAGELALTIKRVGVGDGINDTVFSEGKEKERGITKNESTTIDSYIDSPYRICSFSRCADNHFTEPKNVCISEIKFTFLKFVHLELSETWQCCRGSPVTKRQGIWITLILFRLNCTSKVGGAKKIATYSLVSLSCMPQGTEFVPGWTCTWRGKSLRILQNFL